MREPGFYWVILSGEPMVGEYRGKDYMSGSKGWENHNWLLTGTDRPYADEEFDDIDENKLTHDELTSRES